MMFREPLAAATAGIAIANFGNATGNRLEDAALNAKVAELRMEQWSSQTDETTSSWDSSAFHWWALAGTLQAWKVLPPDWDGDGGDAPSVATIDAAADFADRLQEQNVPVPEYRVAGDGEIEFLWRRGSAFASASFLSDGSFVAYSRPPSGQPPMEINESYSSANHRDFIASLASFRHG
jgi:hypothetical protein